MKRLNQIVLVVSFVAFSWLAMQAVHELGHVLGAAASGGQVERVVLHPLTLSRTDVRPNPHPLFVVWAGPVAGVVLPLLAFVIAYAVRCPGLYLFRFFAGFCLVANGAYVGVGSFDGLGDAGVMLRHGSAAWTLVLFGVLAVVLGLRLWHGLGPKFGLGVVDGKVDRRAAIVSVALLALTIIAEIVCLR